MPLTRKAYRAAILHSIADPAEVGIEASYEYFEDGLLVIENGLIANYQAVVPSTWNAGPRDASGQAGPYEAALVGHVLHDATQPLEILRTIHSFDPCIACAVHVAGPGGERVTVRVR